MMLHYPFQDIKVLLNLDGVNLEGEDEDLDDWVQTYTRYRSNHSPHPPDGLSIEIEVPNDNEFKEASNIGDTDDGPQASWQALAAELPNRRPNRIEDPNLLGYWDMDRAFD
jgi:hypothetical protein